MSWFRKPVNIVITVVAALMAVVAIALIIWGVTTHREDVFLEVCWEGGSAHYVGGAEGAADGACERPEELVWPQEQIPITVAPQEATGAPLASDDRRVRVLEAAIRDANTQAGFELFRLAAGGDLAAADGRAHFGGAFGAGSGAGAPEGAEGDGGTPPPGYVAHRRAGSVLRGDIFVRSDVESVDRILYIVLLHELLHLAGLAHDDDNPGSIMFPLSRDDTMAESMFTARMTDADRAGLRARYRRQ